MNLNSVWAHFKRQFIFCICNYHSNSCTASQERSWMLSVCNMNHRSSGSNCNTIMSDLLQSLNPTCLQCILQTRQWMCLQAVTLDLHNSVHLADIYTTIIHVVLHKLKFFPMGSDYEMKYPKCVLPYEEKKTCILLVNVVISCCITLLLFML